MNISAVWAPILPLLLLTALALWGSRMKAVSKFQLPRSPFWPDAENLGLAMQLAGSPADVDRLLGITGTDPGADANRQRILELQKRDFVFIVLYVLFFVSCTPRFLSNDSSRYIGASAAICAAVLTGIFDVFENLQIIRLVRNVAHGSARRFGQMKWLFFFLAIGMQGVLLLPPASANRGNVFLIWLTGLLLLLAAARGIAGALKLSFDGISSATKVSLYGIVGLALAPLLARFPVDHAALAEYAVLLRVPLLIFLTMIALPILAFFSSARSLLRGLFDVTPLSMLAVTLAATAVAGIVADNSRIVYLHAFQRIPEIHAPYHLFAHVRLVITLLTCLPVMVSAFVFSAKQGRGFLQLTAAAVVGLAGSLYLQNRAQALANPLLHTSLNNAVAGWFQNKALFKGYIGLSGANDAGGPWSDHLGAALGFALAFAIYLILGVYGRWRIGKSRTVPALGSALMVLMLLCSTLSAVAFFFDAWRIPVLLIVLLVGTITAQSGQSDHFYRLIRRNDLSDAASPERIILSSKSPRIVVVAANGGGIQAAAWTAQVLEGLTNRFRADFTNSLRLLSSVSGGSVGAACYVYSLAEPDVARNPAEAAKESSLDEVAWGLGWPDLLRSVLPWVSRGFMGRGRALEKAWCLNSAQDTSKGSHMDAPLSDWNKRVADGLLPGLIMNATIAETGERLLLATTRLRSDRTDGRARIDAAHLHIVNGEPKDVGVITAARLSATFPYVTPASRSDAPGPQPHIVDGGYYDNYGMSTLVEWLDEGLTHTRKPRGVLVLQIHGSPVKENEPEVRHEKIRGWFYQAIAPLTTLVSVRGAGQIAHNDTELQLLQQKWWCAAGIPIHSVTFEFPVSKTPLSWHLTPSDQEAISKTWDNSSDPEIRARLEYGKQQVGNFLAGSDALNCQCPCCLGR
jgi:hypothetical protein